MKTKTLPKTKGKLDIYDEGDIVTNPYSGETYLLDAVELSVYDYIMGLQHIINIHGGPFSPMSAGAQAELRKCLSWFRKTNAEAYMILLD